MGLQYASNRVGNMTRRNQCSGRGEVGAGGGGWGGLVLVLVVGL